MLTRIFRMMTSVFSKITISPSKVLRFRRHDFVSFICLRKQRQEHFTTSLLNVGSPTEGVANDQLEFHLIDQDIQKHYDHHDKM